MLLLTATIVSWPPFPFMLLPVQAGKGVFVRVFVVGLLIAASLGTLAVLLDVYRNLYVAATLIFSFARPCDS